MVEALAAVTVPSFEKMAGRNPGICPVSAFLNSSSSTNQNGFAPFLRNFHRNYFIGKFFHVPKLPLDFGKDCMEKLS